MEQSLTSAVKDVDIHLDGMAELRIEDNPEIEWQGPLPEDIIFEIMDIFLRERFVDVLVLSSTCKGMYNCSLALRYRQVTLKAFNPRIPRAVEIFAAQLIKCPGVARFVQTLKVIGDGFVVDDKWQSTTVEEDCLLYILSHKGFINLKTLALSLPLGWNSLPKSIQEASILSLSHRTLERVQLNVRHAPAEIFSYLSGVSSIEVRGNIKSSFMQKSTEAVCSPSRLEMWDPLYRGDMIDKLLGPDSVLQLTSLEHFKIIIAATRLPSLQGPLSQCRNTLTHLEIHHAWRMYLFYYSYPSVETWLKFNVLQGPEPLNLGTLPHLVSLTLSADLRTLPYAGSANVGPRNFPWIIATLRSLIDTASSPVRKVTLLLRVYFFGIIESSRIRWDEVDRLFGPSIRHRWPNLDTFLVHMVNDDQSRTMDSYELVYRQHLEDHLFSCAPILHEARVFKLQASCAKLEIWNPKPSPDWDEM